MDKLRYLINADDDELEELNAALDEAGIDWELDNGDRYIIDEDNAVEFEEVLDNLGIDYDEV